MQRYDEWDPQILTNNTRRKLEATNVSVFARLFRCRYFFFPPDRSYIRLLLMMITATEAAHDLESLLTNGASCCQIVCLQKTMKNP